MNLVEWWIPLNNPPPLFCCCCCCCCLVLVLVTMTLIRDRRGVNKLKVQHQLAHSFVLVGMMNLRVIWSHLISIQLWLAFGFIWTDYFRLRMVRGTAELYSFIPVWMTLTFTQGHRSRRKLVLKGEDFKEVLWVWGIWIVWVFAHLVQVLECFVLTILLNFFCMPPVLCLLDIIVGEKLSC